MVSIPADLPSRVEETLALCPRFRIVLIGNSGVGKSSLVSCVFNVSLNIDIAHDRAGKADINYEHYSDENPRFILHDSMGFEHGSTGKWDIAESFLRGRASSQLKDQIHAIWLCIETPRTGARLLQTGDEKLLVLAKELSIPVIVVFTKFDMLVSEHFRAEKNATLSRVDKRRLAESHAVTAFNACVEEFQLSIGMQVPCVKVSTKKEYLRETLLELTRVTRNSLHDVEGSLWVPWAAAQQINARQKVELSIRFQEQVHKHINALSPKTLIVTAEYWLNLGTSTFFQGHALIQCIARIHDDIIKVWNFNDPLKLLSKEEEFFGQMVRLVQPVFQDQAIQGTPGDAIATSADVVSIASAIGANFAVPALGGIGLTVMTLRYLYGKYQLLTADKVSLSRSPSTARFLATYIVDLTLVLHRIFIDSLGIEPPRPLSKDLMDCALTAYKDSDSAKIHNHIKATIVSRKPEDAIAELIREALGITQE